MGIMREVDAQGPIATGIGDAVLHVGPQQQSKRLEGHEPRRRYAVLLSSDDSDHVRLRHGGYFGVFRKFLEEEEGERWDGYRVSRGDFPPGWGPEDGDLSDCPASVEAGWRRRRESRQLASLDRYDGLVVTGSCADAHADEPWILALVALLRAACARGKRVLGICFGHQVLCRALGGKTGRNAAGWDIGVTNINFNHVPPASKQQHHPLDEDHDEEAATSWPPLRTLPPSLPVIMFHRDEVLELPPGAEALAWSEKTSVEAFRYGDVAMGIQGHPEYTHDILLDLINRLLQRNIIQISHANAARDTLGSARVNREVWRMLCISFLKGRRRSTAAVTTATAPDERTESHPSQSFVRSD